MATQSTHVLAVDGGGTKTTVWVADKSGKVLGKSTTGPMSLAATNQLVATKNFLSGVQEANQGLKISSFDSVVVGLAGVDTSVELKKAHDVFAEAFHKKYASASFQIYNDTRIALASGTASPNAVCLISGTGSNCVGQNETGKTAKTGGMDFLLSDQGSGFFIGHQVLRAAVKSFDGRTQKSLLEDLVCKHFKIESIEYLKDCVYHPVLNKTQIAQISTLCFEAKDQNDTIANEIITQAIEELMHMVLTVLRRLDLTSTPTDLVLIGGIATDPFIKAQLEARIKANYSQITFVIPDNPPVYGALQIALS